MPIQCPLGPTPTRTNPHELSHISYFLQKLLIKFSRKNNVFDTVNDRKLKKTPKSRLGGIGVFSSILLTLIFFSVFSNIFFPLQVNQIISGFSSFLFPALIIVLSAMAIFIIGLVDDLIGLSYKLKLFVEFAIATALYFCCLKISYISLPFGDEFLSAGAISYFITLIWIISVTNSINLIDGVDGLAGGIIAISSFFMIVIFLISENQLSALLLTPLLGSITGFLPFNKYPSKIFLGDSGSLLAGFLLSIFALKTSNKASFGFMFLVPFALLAIPLLDTFLAFTRRLVNGKSPFKADGDHIHHRLVKKGISEKRTTIVLCTITLLF